MGLDPEEVEAAVADRLKKVEKEHKTETDKSLEIKKSKGTKSTRGFSLRSLCGFLITRGKKR